ncbi:MAG: hypothetical protein ABI592_14395 [Acidobacteriota bacterium]
MIEARSVAGEEIESAAAGDFSGAVGDRSAQAGAMASEPISRKP